MSTIQSSSVLLGRKSALSEGSASVRTVRSIAYSRHGSAITARPIHSRRVARCGWAVSGPVVCSSLCAISISSNCEVPEAAVTAGAAGVTDGSAVAQAAEVGDQAVAHLGREGVLGEAPQRAGDRPQLLEVLGATGTGVEVVLQPPRLGRGQGALEVVRHELDHLDAGEIVGVAMDGLVGHQSESVSFLAVSPISSAVTAS